MSNSPEAVNCYIPLMKHLNMSWAEIKNTPNHELAGLTRALGDYNVLHSFDGYTERDVSEMAKNNPEIRKQYSDYKAAQRKYGKKTQVASFQELIK
jgi:hypothetical protein